MLVHVNFISRYPATVARSLICEWPKEECGRVSRVSAVKKIKCSTHKLISTDPAITVGINCIKRSLCVLFPNTHGIKIHLKFLQRDHSICVCVNRVKSTLIASLPVAGRLSFSSVSAISCMNCSRFIFTPGLKPMMSQTPCKRKMRQCVHVIFLVNKCSPHKAEIFNHQFGVQ